ncbi:MAG: signal peptidase II [Candidatus Binatia bacterium]
MSRLGDPRWRLALLVAATVVVLDQVTKMVVERTMLLHQSIPLTPFLALTYARNTGAAFSLMAGWPAALRLTVLLGVTLVAMAIVVSFLRQTPPEHRWTVGALGAVLGGAAGNLVCRVRYGEVVDFIELHWRHWSWPVFNVADSAITIGVVILVLASRRTPER